MAMSAEAAHWHTNLEFTDDASMMRSDAVKLADRSRADRSAKTLCHPLTIISGGTQVIDQYENGSKSEQM